MSNSEKIPFETILAKLNELLGIKSSNDLVKQLLNPNIKPQNQNNSEPFNNLVNSILSVQNSGQTFAKLKESIDAYVSSGGDDPLVKRFKTQTDDSAAPIWLTSWDEAGGANDYQREASVQNVMAVQSDSASALSPIHVIEMADLNLNFSNRDASTVAAFLKVLPSIEISRAVPYFDCKVITMTRVDEGEEISDERMFNNGMSIHRFLNGQISEDKTIERSIVLAQFAPGQTVERDQLNNMMGGKTTKILSNASMELFTSPQTMVDGNDRFYDLDAREKQGQDLSKKKSIMDPFRPLMTFESFNLSVTPHTGLVTTKAADVKLKLHDRSRMNEIAPLISPSRIGDIELHIEWGWSHPESDPEKNIFGALINQMRVQERYGVANSSYTFTPEGQVDITLKLYTKGAQNVAFDLVRGSSTDHPIDTLKDAVVATRKAVSELRGEGFSLKDDLSAPDFLGKASSAKGILSLDPEEDIPKLEEFIKRLSKGNSPQVFKNLASALKKLVKQSGDFKDKVEDDIDAKIETMKNGDTDKPDPWLVPISEIKVNKKIAVPEINVGSHVSLCKFLLHFVAEPLAKTKKFNEVQMVFYPINDFAMYARDYTTAQYPLNKEIIDSILVEELKKTPTLRIQTLLNIVQKIFINNPGDDIYGMSSFFPYSKDSGKRELIKKYKEDPNKKQELSIQKQDVMKDCYGDEANIVRRFKKPNLTMFVESVPVSEGSGSILRLHFIDKNATSYSTYEQLWQSTSKSELGVIGQFASAKKKQKLLSKKKNFSKKEKDRMKKHEEMVKEHGKKVESLQKQHKEKLKELLEQGLLEEVGNSGKYKIKGGPQKIRGILAANMPTLKYGTEFSGILTASLATQSNAQMETIHMQRSKRDRSQPLDSGSDGLPLRTRPAQLSLSTFGCPLINFGQQFFVDFNTNSTIDDIYSVVGISHSVSPSEFKTDIKLVPLQKFGQFSSLVDSLSDIQEMADEANKDGG